jgi:hypothetical protein
LFHCSCYYFMQKCCNSAVTLLLSEICHWHRFQLCLTGRMPELLEGLNSFGLGNTGQQYWSVLNKTVQI